MKKRKTSSTVPYNATCSTEALQNYNSWDTILNNHNIVKCTIEFLSFPYISINRSMVRLISVNKETREYIFNRIKLGSYNIIII